jgi:hypothetical protein
LREVWPELQILVVSQFLVSSRQLRSVSACFENTFWSQLSEATPNAIDGRYHVRASESSYYAMLVVMKIVHLKVRQIS